MSDAQDDFSFNDDDDNDSGDQSPDNSNSSAGGNAENDKRVTQALHRAEKQLKALEAKNLELETFRKGVEEEKRNNEVTQTFKTLGLNDKAAKLYTGDPAEDAIKQWAVDYGLANIDDVVPTEEQKAEGFRPGAPGGSDTVKTMFTHEEIMEMVKTDPQRADILLSQGKVALNKQE